ncbi:MAG: hypothetical protein OER88_01290 [Planctomycetota bacterium]|nr:hypothetical protein [Planctomycetota bacterium]
MTCLAALILAAPGWIVVGVDGDADEATAWRDGALVATASVHEGRAVLGLLPDASYTVLARGAGAMSDPVAGVRPVAGARDAADVSVVTRRSYPVTVDTEPDAVVRWRGLRLPPSCRLPAGMHRVVVDHGERVSSAERWVRVAGPVVLKIPLDPGLIITCEVVNGEGLPLPGARVDVFGDGYARGRGGWTNAAGIARVMGVSADAVTLRVRAPAYATARRRVWFFPGEARANVSIVLRPGAQAVVRTVDAAGRPVPGARVTLLPAWYERVLEERRLRANAAPSRRRGAAARFTHLVPGRAYRALVSAPGFRPAATATFRAPAGGRALELEPVVLSAGARIDVAAEGGAGREVVCRGTGTRRRRIDRFGRAVFFGLDPGPHRITWTERPDVSAPAEASLARPVIARLAVPEPGAGELRGTVHDAEGKPLAGVFVRVPGAQTMTDGEGAFRLRGLPARVQRWTVRFEPGPACRALAEDPHLPRIERKVAAGGEVRVRLARAGSLRVRLDPGRRRLARARIDIAGAGTGLVRRQRLPRGSREAVIHDLPVGGYAVQVRAPGLLGTDGGLIDAAAAPTEPTVVRVHHGRTARGRLMIRHTRKRATGPPVITDEPALDGWVVLVDGDPRFSLTHVRIEPDGTFLLDGLPPRAVVLAAVTPGYPPTWIRADLAERDVEDLAIVIEPAAEAAVRVLGDEDAPLPGARVRFRTEFGPEVFDFFALARFRFVVADDLDVDEIGPLFRVVADGRGRFAMPHVAPGSYRVDVTADGYKPLRVGVRARGLAARGTLTQIPGLPQDWASPIRLVREDR